MSNSDSSAEPEIPIASRKFKVKVMVHLTVCDKPADTHTSASKKGKTKQSAKLTTTTKAKEFDFEFMSSKSSYLQFLQAILEAHDRKKYSPASLRQWYGFKCSIPPKKAKKDATDVERFEEYTKLVSGIVRHKPVSITLWAELENAKKAKKREPGTDIEDEGSEGEVSESNSDMDGSKKASAAQLIDDDLAHLRQIIEKRWTSQTKPGACIYIKSDGSELILTPYLISQWARAIHDGKATVDIPPGLPGFDISNRQRSLFYKETFTPRSDTSMLTGVLRELRGIITHRPLTPPELQHSEKQSIISAPPVSPPVPSPSKLGCFLTFAEQKLGVANATEKEFIMANKGYGPDILDEVPNNELEACGFNAGDAICLKRGAKEWWKSSEAKRPRVMSQGQQPSSHDKATTPATNKQFSFEKRYRDGSGCQRLYGPGLTQGDTLSEDYEWYWFCDARNGIYPLPQGWIPILDPKIDDSDDQM